MDWALTRGGGYSSYLFPYRGRKCGCTPIIVWHDLPRMTLPALLQRVYIMGVGDTG